MDTDKIIQDLNNRFAKPLPEFYKRRIIFWYDTDKEFEDKIDEIVLDNAKIIVLTDTNNFAVKKLLTYDDKESNYVVYSAVPPADKEDNWLLDIELYSESFHADLISIWMHEMNIEQSPQLRKIVREYRKFFNAAERREKIKSQYKKINKPEQLILAVLSVICSIQNGKPNSIVRTVLSDSLDFEKNTVYQNMVKYDADKMFWKLAEGYGYRAGKYSLKELAVYLFMTGLSKYVDAEHLKEFDKFISKAYQNYCYDFTSEWYINGSITDLYKTVVELEREYNIPQKLDKLPIDVLITIGEFPCVDEIVLKRLMTDISNNIINTEVIKNAVNGRRIYKWSNSFADCYDCIEQTANMKEFHDIHADGFHIADAREIWEKYTKEYYRMDTYYGDFQKHFRNCINQFSSELDDLIKQTADVVERLYTNWFLGQLGGQWSDICTDELAQKGRISEIPLQQDFYKNKVEVAKNRQFVIISDALRYDVAVRLAEKLRVEEQCIVNVSSMQGIFPTITKFGMAALLPHDKLSVEVKGNNNERLVVLADGQSTESGNRDKILKSAKGENVALQYKKIEGLKRAERSALVKGKDVVYIYHDTIDEAGHTSDGDIFDACDEAIKDIKKIVRMIENEFSGTNIFITSDHGFLYTNCPLKEDSKLSLSGYGDKVIEYGRRYAIVEKNCAPEYLMPVKFLPGSSEYDAYTPRENVRIKMNGGGMNFVHGGISLQEMVVPLIEYKHLRNSYSTYIHNKEKYDTKPVTIALTSGIRKISNMIFPLNFYQVDAVSSNRKSAKYKLYFTNSDGSVISDIKEIIADKAGDNREERTFRLSFNLKSMKYHAEEIYELVIEDEANQVADKVEFHIDIPFVDDFKFFDD